MAEAEGRDEGAMALRVRRQPSTTPWPEKGLLTKAWEEDAGVRDMFRANKGHLLAWPNPQLVGVASLRALSLNVGVVKLAIEVWGSVCTQAKSMVVDWLKQEARAD